MKNDTLKWLFDQKKEQLGCLTSHRMFQFIPAQFCEMVSRVGFQAEFAPPDGMSFVLQIPLDSTNQFLTS